MLLCTMRTLCTLCSMWLKSVILSLLCVKVLLYICKPLCNPPTPFMLYVNLMLCLLSLLPSLLSTGVLLLLFPYPALYVWTWNGWKGPNINYLRWKCQWPWLNFFNHFWNMTFTNELQGEPDLVPPAVPPTVQIKVNWWLKMSCICVSVCLGSSPYRGWVKGVHCK